MHRFCVLSGGYSRWIGLYEISLDFQGKGHLRRFARFGTIFKVLRVLGSFEPNLKHLIFGREGVKKLLTQCVSM